MEKDITPTQSKDALNAAFVDILSRDSNDSLSIFGFVEINLRRFNLYPRVEAYEILVEAYLRGHRYLKTGETIKNPLAWLRRTAFNIIRENSRRLSKEQPLDPSQIESLPIRHDIPESEGFKEELSAFHKALEVLGQQDSEAQRLIHLRHIKGLSWREIRTILEAEFENAPTEEVLRQRASRARRRLRKIFLEIQPS